MVEHRHTVVVLGMQRSYCLQEKEQKGQFPQVSLSIVEMSFLVIQAGRILYAALLRSETREQLISTTGYLFTTTPETLPYSETVAQRSGYWVFHVTARVRRFEHLHPRIGWRHSFCIPIELTPFKEIRIGYSATDLYVSKVPSRLQSVREL
jgi:hypothetical protein